MNNNMDTFKEQVLIMNKEGSSQNEIANALGSTRDKVRYILGKEGLTKKKTQRELVCKECGKMFNTKSEHANFCQEKCRSSYNKKNRGHKSTCPQCNTEFIHYSNKFCSVECWDLHLSNQRKDTEHKNSILSLVRVLDIITDCEECGRRFSGNRRYCSDACMRTHYYRRAYTPKSYNHKCRECGTHYSDAQSNSAGCSDSCKRRWSNRVRETDRRKRIRDNGEVDWDISVERLVKRDKGYCYLCNERVDSNDYVINEKGFFIAGETYPSIEHVIPVVMGGSHTWSNVKLAHRNCNSKKGVNIF